jgi:hypothetical protein
MTLFLKVQNFRPLFSKTEQYHTVVQIKILLL